jgi:hypothetical protein
VRSGEVTLTGVVASDYERRVVGQMVGMVAGVHELTNLIEIHVAEPPAAKREAMAFPVSMRPLARIAAITLGLVIATWAIWRLTSALSAPNDPTIVDSLQLYSGKECRIALEFSR